ncbi:MAG: NADAR family protein [Anaerolineae bacterium]
MAIYFYSTKDPYGEFSNFAKYPIELKGKIWPTSEHYFQAQKFAGQPDEEEIRQAAKPMDAARMGRERHRKLRSDWEVVKDNIMLEALRAKFSQHPMLKDLLLSTGDEELIEHTTNDNYWADGGDGSGKNMLGKLLAQVRQELRQTDI